jgi:polyphosphate kinase
MSEQTLPLTEAIGEIQPSAEKTKDSSTSKTNGAATVSLLTPASPFFFTLPKAVATQPVPEGADLDNPALYFNQELGWIDFNWRVFHLALDSRTPLLERIRFLAITAGNLDEFVQKRIGGLKRQEAAGVRTLSPDGRTPTEQLNLLRDAVRLMHRTMTQSWEQILKPALREQANILICNFEELSPSEQERLHRYSQTHIYPILTPLIVDPGHPFPFISNLSLSLTIILRHSESSVTRFARLKIPSHLPRFLPLHDKQMSRYPHEPLRFLPIEQLVAHYLDELFTGMEIVRIHPFRITRNADLDRDEEVASDLLSMISDELRERRFAPVVRLEVDKAMPKTERHLLMRELELEEVDLYEVSGLIDLTGCFQIANLNLPDFLYEPWLPKTPRPLTQERGTSIFDIIRQGDLLVHHPYDSFATSVQRLVEEAAADDQVLAIKQTLYRTSDESPIVEALIQAAEQGKQVAVLVEVKARFDEANNIEWARMLENSGVHVAYGLVGLKTHTKATLIVRRENNSLRTYCHIGTGNYNPKTAQLYTDLGLLTCDPTIGRDIVNLFHYLTGYAPRQHYDKVIVAPRNMRETFNRLIQQEINHQQAHGNGQIIAKMNGLDDTDIIKELYRASQAGVQIDLIVRGHSRLRPGLKGYSDNIRLISILGRFLEHDRIFYFHNNGQPLTYIGSADWRGRNLNDRVELITPIEEPTLKNRLIDILKNALSDNRLAWELDTEGNYHLRQPASPETELNFQQLLMEQAIKRAW